MNKILFLFVFSGVFLFSGSKSDDLHLTGMNLSETRPPVMEFRETTYDFGFLQPGAEAKHDFIFTNKGKEPIVIASVRSGCGCTTPVWTRQPIRKNKHGTITVKYNTNIWGKFRKSITVISNAENSPVTLVIRGEVKYIPEEDKNPEKK